MHNMGLRYADLELALLSVTLALFWSQHFHAWWKNLPLQGNHFLILKSLCYRSAFNQVSLLLPASPKSEWSITGGSLSSWRLKQGIRVLGTGLYPLCFHYWCAPSLNWLRPHAQALPGSNTTMVLGFALHTLCPLLFTPLSPKVAQLTVHPQPLSLLSKSLGDFCGCLPCPTEGRGGDVSWRPLCLSRRTVTSTLLVLCQHRARWSPPGIPSGSQNTSPPALWFPKLSLLIITSPTQHTGDFVSKG